MVFGVPSCKYNIVWYTPKPYSNYKGPYIRGVGLGGFVLQGFGSELETLGPNPKPVLQ